MKDFRDYISYILWVVIRNNREKSLTCSKFDEETKTVDRYDSF